MRRALAGAVLGGLVLTACASPEADLRSAVADLTDAANDRDADAVRREGGVVLSLLDEQVRSGELTPDEEAALRALAQTVLDRADLVTREVAPIVPPTDDATAPPSTAPPSTPPKPATTAPSPAPTQPPTTRPPATSAPPTSAAPSPPPTSAAPSPSATPTPTPQAEGDEEQDD